MRRGAEASLVNAGGLEKILGGVAQETLIAAATIKKIRSFVLDIGIDVDRSVTLPNGNSARGGLHSPSSEERFDRIAHFGCNEPQLS